MVKTLNQCGARIMEIRLEKKLIEDAIRKMNIVLFNAHNNNNLELASEITEDIKCFNAKLEQLNDELDSISYEIA